MPLRRRGPEPFLSTGGLLSCRVRDGRAVDAGRFRPWAAGQGQVRDPAGLDDLGERGTRTLGAAWRVASILSSIDAQRRCT